MDTSDRKQDSSTAGAEAQRTVIKSALNDIAAEVGDAIRNARLDRTPATHSPPLYARLTTCRTKTGPRRPKSRARSSESGWVA